VFLQLVYRIYRIDLAGPVPVQEPGGSDLTFRLLTADDRDIIRKIEADHEWFRGQLADKIRAGGLCLVALDGSKLAGFNLIGFGRVYIPLLNMHRVFHKKDAWSEHIAVDKDLRQKGCGAQLRYRIFEELRKRGYRRLYGGTLASNTASLRLASKVGFRQTVDIHYVRILGRERWQYRRVKS
jgi:GNAT superfamily N-acetyltransferase